MNKIEQLKDLLKDDPDNSFILFALAKEYETVENNDQAKTFYLSLLNKNPDYIGCYYHFGKLLETLNDEVTAKEIYQQGISKAQDVNDLHSISELRTALLNLEIKEL